MVIAGLLAACAPNPSQPPGGPGRVLEGPLVGRSLAVARGALWVGAPGLDGEGGVYRFNAPTGSLDGAAARLLAAAPTDVGDSFAPCADLDGNGVEDVVVGAPDRGEMGGSWFVLGPLAGDVDLGAATFSAGIRQGGHAGAVVACGDVDGDGLDEVAVSAPDTDAGGVAVHTGTVDLLHLDDASAVDKIANLDTAWADSHLGYRTAVDLGHDLDGDGVGDLVVGGYGADRVHIVFGPFAGSYVTSTAGPILQGEEGEATGHAVAIGDLDGDGALDLAIGAPAATGDRGAVWLASGPFTPDAGDSLLATAARRLDGVGPGDQAGFSLATGGDVDGDGAAELLVGAPFAGGVGPEAGAVYVVHGPGDLLGNLDTADALLLGDVERGRLGWSVAAGDIGSDGSIEFAAGAPEADVDDRVGVGTVYVFSGDVSGVVYPDAAVGRILD